MQAPTKREGPVTYILKQILSAPFNRVVVLI